MLSGYPSDRAEGHCWCFGKISCIRFNVRSKLFSDYIAGFKLAVPIHCRYRVSNSEYFTRVAKAAEKRSPGNLATN